MDEEEEDNWACLSWAELKEDLDECEEAKPAAGLLSLSPYATEEDLRLVVQQREAAPKGIDLDSLFAAHHALHDIAAELQAALVQVEKLQFCCGSLAGALAHGPLRPPRDTEDAWAGFSADQAFGPAAAPKAPPPLELAAPAAAGALPEYRRLLTGLPPALFVERKLQLCVGEVDHRQDEKDINRDNLLINGAAISGAQGGYEAAVSSLAAALLKAGNSTGGAWLKGAEVKAAQLLLSALNRTSSGFAAFEEVLRLFNCPDVTIVAPDSAAARPLEAVVVGGVVLGRAHTCYSVRKADGSGAPLAVVDAYFVFRVGTSTLRRLTHSVGGHASSKATEIRAVVLLNRS